MSKESERSNLRVHLAKNWQVLIHLLGSRRWRTTERISRTGERCKTTPGAPLAHHESAPKAKRMQLLNAAHSNHRDAPARIAIANAATAVAARARIPGAAQADPANRAGSATSAIAGEKGWR